MATADLQCPGIEIGGDRLLFGRAASHFDVDCLVSWRRFQVLRARGDDLTTTTQHQSIPGAHEAKAPSRHYERVDD